MEPVIISWTPTNWATIVLMVLGAFLLLKLVSLGYRAATGKSGASSA